MTERPIIWKPSIERVSASSMAKFLKFVEARHGKKFPDYNSAWEWSVSDLNGFWQSIWDFFDIQSSSPHTAVLAKRKMPGAEWFPGAQVNFASQILRHAEDKGDTPALILQSETFGRVETTWLELRDHVASLAAHLKDMGVGKGDRVVAILPNSNEALIAFLATASLGAIWSLCALDMGQTAILDRFKQIDPKVLIVQDGYVYGGKTIDRSMMLQEIIEGLPNVAHHIHVSSMARQLPEGTIEFTNLLKRKAVLEFEQVPFDCPLWVLFSSGTTGNPKAIVHGHGGVLLEFAQLSLHQNVQSHDRYSWMTSSGWMMWNAQLVALGQGATLAMFDGAVNYPNMDVLWRFVSDEKITYFGAGAAYFTACMKAKLKPSSMDLNSLQSIGSTGSPLTEDGYRWVYQNVKSDVSLAPVSGGTDIVGAFVCGNPMDVVRVGEMQARALGTATRAFDEAGCEVIGEVGELVCTEPLPSMPLYFWGDKGNKVLIDSYYDMYPGIWRQGDWIEITPEGGAVIYGRSDATINRKGLRLGSSEIYRAVEALDGVLDSMVIDLEYLGRDSFMVLFVVTRDAEMTEELIVQITKVIQKNVSPRFVPNEFVQMTEIPCTLSGKKLEVPVKKLLLGGDAAVLVNRDSMVNPDSFDAYVEYAQSRALADNGT